MRRYDSMWSVLWLIVFLISSYACAGDYDPLAVPETPVQTLELTVLDETRDRELPILVYLPHVGTPAPVVLFSHGLGGSRNGSVYLGKHWAGRGYVAVFLQHPGSDDSVWKTVPPRERMAAMQQAANLQNSRLRFQDVPAVIDQLARWHDQTDHLLHQRLLLNQLGMSGHSFGAVTTQAVSGQAPPFGKSFTDQRIKAAIAFSPSSPRNMRDPAQAFGKVAIPWLLMTGTNDTAPIGNTTVDSRRAVFPALPPGDKYELVLNKAEHSAFTDRALPGDKETRNPNHHRAILAISTAFWDAYLRQDVDAKAWLTGNGPRSVLESADEWQQK